MFFCYLFISLQINDILQPNNEKTKFKKVASYRYTSTKNTGTEKYKLVNRYTIS